MGTTSKLTAIVVYVLWLVNSPSLPTNGIKISEPTVAWLLAFSRASGRLHACICFESHRHVLKFPSFWPFLIITVLWFTKLMHSKVRGPYWLCEARQQHSVVEENFPAYWISLKSLDSLSGICKFRRDKFSPWHMSMIKKKWHGNSQWKLTIKKSHDGCHWTRLHYLLVTNGSQKRVSSQIEFNKAHK